MRIDRYGSPFGTFASPEGTPFGQRALPAAHQSLPYTVYEVTRPIPNVQAGLSEPWFCQPGMGVQYELPTSVQDLLDSGHLAEVTQ